MADRDKYVYMAKLAEQAEKYDGERICNDERCAALNGWPWLV